MLQPYKRMLRYVPAVEMYRKLIVKYPGNTEFNGPVGHQIMRDLKKKNNAALLI
jgi:hypothetical protein